MKNIKKYIISSIVFSLVLFAVSFSYTNAATIGFSPSSGSYSVGDTLNIKVYVGTDSQSVNAISANISYPTDLLSLSSISKTGSIINLWAQEPSFSNAEGRASFEGVMLNGYAGNSGNAVTLIFKAKAAGTATLRFNNASVLANDGNGTEVLTNSGFAILRIEKTEAKPAPTTKVEVVKEKDTTIAIAEIKNNVSQYSPNKFLITSTQPVVDKSYTIQIDNMASIIWVDDGTHIYQAPELQNGKHNIKVTAINLNLNELSGSLSFYTTFLKVPVITYYPSNLFVDDFMVLKGIADPSVDIEFTITNVDTGGVILDHVPTNGDGKFTYVPDNRMSAGTYSITARSQAVNGVMSNYMEPIQIINKDNKISFFVNLFSKYVTLFIPFVALIIFIIGLMIYGYYHLRRYNHHLNKKLANAEEIVSKSFEILEEDEEEEIAAFRKIRAKKGLNGREMELLDKFKKDISEAEKVIQKELEKVTKSDSN